MKFFGEVLVRILKPGLKTEKLTGAGGSPYRRPHSPDSGQEASLVCSPAALPSSFRMFQGAAGFFLLTCRPTPEGQHVVTSTLFSLLGVSH